MTSTERWATESRSQSLHSKRGYDVLDRGEADRGSHTTSRVCVANDTLMLVPIFSVRCRAGSGVDLYVCYFGNLALGGVGYARSDLLMLNYLPRFLLQGD